jgi:hypothetical protein
MQGYPKRSTDGTVEYLKSFNHPKLIVRDFDFKGRNDDVQYHIRDEFCREHEMWKPGNWVVQWDDDIAFFNKDLEKIRHIMETTEHDTLMFRERRFLLNFRFNTLREWCSPYHFDRITEGAYYKKTWKMTYEDGEKYDDVHKVGDVIYFHYPYVKTPERAKFRWKISIEKKTRASIGMYDKFMSIKWRKDKDVHAYKRDIENINNEKGFNIYTGKHPEVMRMHPWLKINDCRKIDK